MYIYIYIYIFFLWDFENNKINFKREIILRYIIETKKSKIESNSLVSSRNIQQIKKYIQGNNFIFQDKIAPHVLTLGYYVPVLTS